MYLANIDVTSVDACHLKNSFEVMRKPRVFYASINGPHVFLYPLPEDCQEVVIDTSTLRPRKISLAAFKSSFESTNGCDNNEPGAYFKKTQISHAAIINSAFHLYEVDPCNKDYELVKGRKGDYLVTRSSGINEIVTSEEFNELFIKKTEISKIYTPTIKITRSEEPTMP